MCFTVESEFNHFSGRVVQTKSDAVSRGGYHLVKFKFCGLVAEEARILLIVVHLQGDNF